MASRRDQSTVSKAEFKKYDRKKVRAIIVDAKGKIASFEGFYGVLFGTLALNRLRKSAKIGKRSTLEHCLRLAK